MNKISKEPIGYAHHVHFLISFKSPKYKTENDDTYFLLNVYNKYEMFVLKSRMAEAILRIPITFINEKCINL